MKTVNALAYVLCTALSFSAIASPEHSIIRPSADKNSAIFVEKDAGADFIRFSKCQIDEALVLSQCQNMGKSEGYSLSEVNKRYRQLRRNKWLKRLVVIPAGALCGALLGGAVGYHEVKPIFDASNEIIVNGAHLGGEIMKGSVDAAVRNPVAGLVAVPVGIAAGAATTVVTTEIGILGHIFGASIVAAYSTFGLTVGAPATWTLLRFFAEPSSQSQKALAGPLNGSGEIIKYRGSMEKFEKYLLAALDGIEP